MVLCTVVNEGNYLLEYTKYLIMSAKKYEPDKVFVLYLVDYSGKYDDLIMSWNNNVVIRPIDLHFQNQYNYKYCYKLFIFHRVLKEFEKDVLFLDGDIVIRGELTEIENDLNSYDLLFRYRSSLAIPGPETEKFGAQMNSGVVGFAYNERSLLYTKELFQRARLFLNSGKNPVRHIDGTKTNLTTFDQEMPFYLYQNGFAELKFFPLKEIYNDSYFRKISKVWHAKGNSRNNSKYKLSKAVLDKKPLKSILLLPSAILFDIKSSIKMRMKERLLRFAFSVTKPAASYDTITIINSNYLLYNKWLYNCRNIDCYDTEPIWFHKNRNKIEGKINIRISFLDDIESIELDEDSIVITDHINPGDKGKVIIRHKRDLVSRLLNNNSFHRIASIKKELKNNIILESKLGK